MVKTYKDKKTGWNVNQFPRGEKAFFSPSGRYKIMVERTNEKDKGRTVWEITVLKKFEKKFIVINTQLEYRSHAFFIAESRAMRLEGVI